jgi:diaminopimelate epimerase
MGNPHCILFVGEVDRFPVDILGPVIECDSRFPERCNVHFVELIEENFVRMRTWERGSGETLACGTGASAVCVALGLIKGWRMPVRAGLPGGELVLHWREDNHVIMRGPAVEVFRGEFEP